jgi:hypothetical protein
VILGLLVSFGTGSATEPDDVSIARRLANEAYELCGADCNLSAEFGAVLAKTGDEDASKKAFANAWAAAAKLKDGVERRIALCGIARLQAEAGQSKEAIANSQRLESLYERAMTLERVLKLHR